MTSSNDPRDSISAGSHANPPPDPCPDEAHTEFYKWVGVCIKELAKIEFIAHLIFELALKADKRHMSIIFFRTPSFEARLSLVDEIVKAVLPDKDKLNGAHYHEHVKMFDAIMKDTRHLMQIRNTIAHAPIA